MRLWLLPAEKYHMAEALVDDAMARERCKGSRRLKSHPLQQYEVERAHYGAESDGSHPNIRRRC